MLLMKRSMLLATCVVFTETHSLKRIDFDVVFIMGRVGMLNPADGPQSLVR